MPPGLSWIRVGSVAALVMAALLCGWQARQLALPFQFDYVEGMMLHGVNVAGSGNTLYPRIGELPILITAYPPLYYYLCAAGNALFGRSFFFGRLVSLLAMLGMAAVVAWMVRKRTPFWPAAALAAAFFYLTLPARNWAVLMRVDALEVALAVAGFAVAIFSSPGRLSLYGAAAFFLASFFTKHTMFAAPLAVLAAWWLGGRRRDAVVLAATLAGVALAAFGAAIWLTDGAFYIYLFGIHGDPVLWDKWFREIAFLGRTIPVVLALALWFLGDEVARWWRERDAPDPVALYLVAGFLSTFFGAKLASFWNHYLEFAAVACLAAGCAASRLATREPSRPLLWIALALQGLLAVPLMKPWSPGQWFHGAAAVALALGAALCAALGAARLRIADSPGACAPGRGLRIAGSAALVAAAVLTFPGVWHWSLMMREMWPSLAALAAVALLLADRGAGGAWAAAVIALAATAGTAALLPVSAPVALVLWRKRRLEALIFIVATLATVAMLSPETNPFHSPHSLPVLGPVLEGWLPQVTLLVLVALLALTERPAFRGPAGAVVAAYGIATFAFAVLFRDARHWIELAPALAMLAVSAGRTETTNLTLRPTPRCSMRIVAPVALGVQLALLSPFPLWMSPGYDAAQLRWVYERVARAPDPIVSENVGLLSVSGKPVLLSDPFAYRLSPAYFPETPLLARIERRELGMVAMARDPTSPEFPAPDTDPVWSRRFVETLLKNYRKSHEFDVAGERFFLFSPRRSGPPKEYTCRRAQRPVVVDGDIGDQAWRAAPWTSDFVDIEGAEKPRPRFRTRARLLWDDRYLYVAAEMEEPHVWGTLTEHDSIIYRDNDFELFLDPNGDTRDYFELEVNALNTAFDLMLPKPYKEGGKAVISWNMDGLRKAVKVQGTLNEPRDLDRGWTIELAVPWSALRERAGTAAPPVSGDRWRLNFSRVQWQHEIVDGRYRKVAGRKEDNWVWTPQGVVNMHVPDRWGYLRFAK